MAIPGIPCLSIIAGPQDLAITFPGGAVVSVCVPSPKIPSAAETARALLGEVNAALAPLAPFFAVYECLDAVTDIVTNPGKFIAAFAKMAGMAPAVAIPVMVGKIIDLLIAYLQGVEAQLQALIASLASIAAAATKATRLGNAQLQATVNCATGKVSLQMASLNAGAAPLNSLIGVINALLGLVPGAPAIPTLADLGPDPAAALTPLADAIAALQTIRGAFPL